MQSQLMISTRVVECGFLQFEINQRNGLNIPELVNNDYLCVRIFQHEKIIIIIHFHNDLNNSCTFLNNW